MNLKPEAKPRFDDSDALLRWIHCDLALSEFAPVLHDARFRREQSAPRMQAALRPLVVYSGDEPVAASYFKLLCGSVATLGGVRAVAGRGHAAAELIQWQVDMLRRFAIPQIQAVVRHDDLATTKLVELTGFKQLTCIEHQWLDVSPEVSEVIASGLSAEGQSTSLGALGTLNGIPADSKQTNLIPTAERRATLNSKQTNSRPTAERRATLNWRPAHHFARDRMAQFIESTFIDTLDCPAMNGRRSRGEVLAGFLDGRQHRQTAPWWEVLEVDGRIAGCLLLQQHSAELVELVYMGLLPFARGQRLGQAMVQRAINTTRRLGGLTLVVAVDEQNWPALDVYRRCGFQNHQRLQVWITD